MRPEVDELLSLQVENISSGLLSSIHIATRQRTVLSTIHKVVLGKSIRFKNW